MWFWKYNTVDFWTTQKGTDIEYFVNKKKCLGTLLVPFPGQFVFPLYHAERRKIFLFEDWIKLHNVFSIFFQFFPHYFLSAFVFLPLQEYNGDVDN